MFRNSAIEILGPQTLTQKSRAEHCETAGFTFDVERHTKSSVSALRYKNAPRMIVMITVWLDERLGPPNLHIKVAS